MGRNTLDHIEAFKVLFQCYPVENFLEFGLGVGTQFFLDNCKKVTSVELAWDASTKWFDRCKKGYRHYQNWQPHFHVLPESVCSAERRIRAEQGESVYAADYTYLTDLRLVVYQFVPEDTYDLVFVDPGTHLRADIVNMLFGRAKVIVTHDTFQLPHYYGWNRIITPHTYKSIEFPTIAGVRIWTHHTLGEVTRFVKDAVKTL